MGGLKKPCSCSEFRGQRGLSVEAMYRATSFQSEVMSATVGEHHKRAIPRQHWIGDGQDPYVTLG